MSDYCVVDETEWNDDGTAKVIDRFPSEQAAAEFICHLPGAADGRYGIDGPEQ